MMRNYANAQCHLGSFHNINNISAFSIDCVFERMRLLMQKMAAKTEVMESWHIHVAQVTTSLRWIIMG